MVANDHYIVVTVECSRCKIKQKVHIADSRTRAPIAPQMIPCINCDNPFKVVVPDRILRGPFPA